MERSELALVPEWLRSSGSLPGGGGSSTHHFPSSSNSDAASLGHHIRNRTSRSISDFDTPRSHFLDRSASSNSRRNTSTNGTAKHAYSSFGRSHRERDRDRDREKERSSFGDHWDRDSPNILGTIFPRVENDTLRRFQSKVTRKQDELVQRKVSLDSKPGLSNNHYNGNGTNLGVLTSGNVHKIVFEKDFPSLANEERQGGPDIGRVASPGLSTAVQSLPVSNLTLIGEGWRSALVEVPTFPLQQTPHGTPGSGATNTGSGLNMAEALALAAPSRANTDPLLSVKTQKFEELTIKQSRQLIPVTPTMPKTSVLNSSDKLKPKLGVRSSEVVSAAKNGQQQPLSLHLVNQPQPVGNVKSDASKTSHGKFLVLKPVWDNGFSTTPRDVSSPPNNASSRIANGEPSPTAAPPLIASASLNTLNSTKLTTFERKSLNHGSALEKRPSPTQAQSRKDFLNLMRKKSSMNIAPVLPDSGPEITSLAVEKSSEEVEKEVSTPVSPHTTKNGGELTSASGESQRYSDIGEQNMNLDIEVYPDEEETAFLRSLGWEENAGEDEGLTEEEINAFYQEYMKLRPSLKQCGSVMPKLTTLTESHATGVGGGSSDSGSEV